MFPRRYYPASYFAPRYWPQSSDSGIPATGPGERRRHRVSARGVHAPARGTYQLPARRTHKVED